MKPVTMAPSVLGKIASEGHGTESKTPQPAQKTTLADSTPKPHIKAGYASTTKSTELAITKEQQIKAELADEEARIHKMYRDYAQNDLKREKQSTYKILRALQEEGRMLPEVLIALRDEHAHLKAALKRYKHLIENFDEEHRNLVKFKRDQAKEKRALSKKKDWLATQERINERWMESVEQEKRMDASVGNLHAEVNPI